MRLGGCGRWSCDRRDWERRDWERLVEGLVPGRTADAVLDIPLSGATVLDPSIRARYTPRSTFRSLARQYFQYGFWKTVVMAEHRQVQSASSELADRLSPVIQSLPVDAGS